MTNPNTPTDTDEVVDDINIFEGMEALDNQIREELVMVTGSEFASFDDDLSCHEETGETVDEIAEAIASEFSPGTSHVPHLSDGETDSDEEGTEATENPFRIRSPKNLEDILGSLEEYCYDTDSACLPLIFQMRKHFNNDRIGADVALRKRQSQTTLDAFLKK